MAGDEADLPTEQRALREKYQRLREVQRGLNSRLTKMIARSGIEESARQLGLWQRGIIVFGEEDDASVLMDFAIHEYRIRGGTTAVERLAKQSMAPAGSDERLVLDALLRARFTLLRVDEAIPGVGVHVSDRLYAREFLLADIGLSDTAVEGLHLCARVLEFPQFCMQTGAALPFDADAAESAVLVFGDVFDDVALGLTAFRPKQRAKVAAFLTRMALSLEDVEDGLEF